MDSAIQINAEAYVARPFVLHDMEGEWSYDHFETEDLKEYIEDVREYLNEEGEEVSD